MNRSQRNHHFTRSGWCEADQKTSVRLPWEDLNGTTCGHPTYQFALLACLRDNEGAYLVVFIGLRLLGPLLKPLQTSGEEKSNRDYKREREREREKKKKEDDKKTEEEEQKKERIYAERERWTKEEQRKSE